MRKIVATLFIIAMVSFAFSAQYVIDIKPDTIPDSDITWTAAYGNVSFPSGNKGRVVNVQGEDTGKFKLEIDVKGLGLNPKPHFYGEVLNPETVPVTVWVVRDDNGNSPAIEATKVTECFSKANWAFEQVAMTYEIVGSINYTNRSDWLNIVGTNSIYSQTREMFRLPKNGDRGLRLIFINTVSNVITTANGSMISTSVVGISGMRGIAMATKARSFSLISVAHEFGHACGLRDIYVRNSRTALMVTGPITEARVPWDWGGGYYPADVTQSNLIQRLLMYGESLEGKGDIPTGRVYGLWYEVINGSRVWHLNEANGAPVGVEDLDRNPNHL